MKSVLGSSGQKISLKNCVQNIVNKMEPNKDENGKRKHYWFRVVFGKWEEEGVFDPETSSVFVSAWDAFHAARKATVSVELDEGEIVTSVEFLGYPQI